ncbi:hypothetical protein AeRB84_008656 [Aphanomyces euteiches]|nr:hypothetical protein AeRB84_008656 [Aphanomyces euteiches]
MSTAETPPHRRPGRPVVKNHGRHGQPKYKREFYSCKKKLFIINWAREHSMRQAMKRFFKGVTGVQRKTIWKRVRRWEKQREHIESAANNPSTASNRTWRLVGIATTLTANAEENIARWVSQLRAEGVPVSNLMLRCKALEIARDENLNENQFKASTTWIKSFTKRWGFAMRARTRSGQSNFDEGLAVLETFSSHIRSIVAKFDIDEIYNADQTSVNYEYIPKQTWSKSGTKSVWIKCAGKEKEE